MCLFPRSLFKLDARGIAKLIRLGWFRPMHARVGARLPFFPVRVPGDPLPSPELPPHPPPAPTENLKAITKATPAPIATGRARSANAICSDNPKNENQEISRAK